MAYTAYQLVEGTADAVSTQIAALLGSSWQPFGPPFITPDQRICQPVVQGTPSEGTPAGSVTLANGATVDVTNSNDSTSVSGVAAVTGTTLTSVALPATTAIIATAQVLSGVAPSGTYISHVTFTVSNGAITAIVLS